MNYNKIEELYVDFILDLIGPNQKREKERLSYLTKVKGIITNIFQKKLPDYITFIFPYGSFPLKTYLNNADIDLTIFFESKIEQKVFVELPINLINQSIMTIKEEFERYNKESSTELFSDIKIINADIRLLKCKIDSISLDISINNFSGLYKIVFIDYIENLFNEQFIKNNLFYNSSYSDNKINIFRRTLLLIKGWCLYEGNLMGSNIGLMASYTLEILVIFVFNLHYEYIYNEFDGFEKFFEVMEKIDWENNIISLFGIFSNINFQKKLSIYNSQNSKDKTKEINEPFWYYHLFSKDKNKFIQKDKEIEPLLQISELKKMIGPINKSMENMYLKKEGKMINAANFDKLLNILDPLNNYNNLGKSINYHSNSKMKKVITHMNKQLKQISLIRKKGNPFMYLNSLLNLFKVTLSKTYIELFINYINTPKLMGSSKIFKIAKKCNNGEEKKIKIDANEVQKFNELFIDPELNVKNLNILEDEDNDNYVEDLEDGIYLEKSEDIEDDLENDEYAEEKEESGEDEDKPEINDNNNNYKQYLKDDNIKFIPLINEEIMKKINEIKQNKQKIINNNNQLLKESQDYSSKLETFLKAHKII